MIELQDPITVTQAANMKGISYQLMRYYLLKQYTPEPITIGGHRYFERKDIKEWKIPKFKRTKKGNGHAKN